MRLRELLTVINSHITLELFETKEKYEIKADIPEEHMNCEVKVVEAKDNSFGIKLGEPKKVLTLEELGYSFEVGV